MKRLRFHLAHPTDEGRVDVVESKPGAVYADTQATTKYTPLVNASQVVAVELLDDEAPRFVPSLNAPAKRIPGSDRRLPHVFSVLEVLGLTERQWALVAEAFEAYNEACRQHVLPCEIEAKM